MHPYLNHADGWETLAGQDTEVDRKSCRMLLVSKRRAKQGAILRSFQSNDWTTFVEGDKEEVAKRWNQIEKP